MSTYFSNSKRPANKRTYDNGAQFRQQRKDMQPREERKPPVRETTQQPIEIENYRYNPEQHNSLDLTILKDNFPALPSGQTIVSTLENKIIEFNTHAIKIYVSNLFKDDRIDDPYETLISTFQQISALFTRKFARTLDYKLPDMDEELFKELSDCPAIKDKLFVSSKQSEMYLIFNEAGSQHVDQETFYNVYRSFIPLINVSNCNDINSIALLKIYNNVLFSEMKIGYEKGGKPTARDYMNIEGLTQLANFFYETTREGNELHHALTKALLFQRLSSVGTFLADYISFLSFDDIAFLNDEYDGIEKREYLDFIDYLEHAEVQRDEVAFRDLCIQIVKNIVDYKMQKISCTKYDSNYRKLLMSFLSSELCAEAMREQKQSVYVPTSEMTEEKKIKILFNAMPEAGPDNLYNITEKAEEKILNCKQSTVIDILFSVIQNHERAGVEVYPLIQKHYQRNPAFLEKLCDLDCSQKNADGITALLNLFKLAAFTGNLDIFNIFLEKNKAYTAETKTEMYHPIAMYYDILLRDKLFEMIKPVYRCVYPAFITDYLTHAMNFYHQRGLSNSKKGVFIKIIFDIMKNSGTRKPETQAPKKTPRRNFRGRY